MEPYKPNKPWISVNLPSREELIAMAMGLIPGGRALKNMYDNPEGSFTETLDLAAEDLVPFYANLIKPAVKGEDIDAEQALKEAAMFGIPIPKAKFRMPNTYKEAEIIRLAERKPALADIVADMMESGAEINAATVNAELNKRGLLADEASLHYRSEGETRGPKAGYGQPGRVSSRYQVNTTHEQRPLVTSVLQPGPRNIGSDILSQGQMAMNQNTLPTRKHSGKYTGEKGYQGDMYDSRRSLVNTTEYGPFQWEDIYSRNLDNAINANNSKYEYLMNETRLNSRGQQAMPKETAIEIALKQGRPDIAEMIRLDDKPKVTVTKDKRFNSYHSTRNKAGMSFEEFLDQGNRSLERDLREEFSQLPNDELIRERFANHYGVRDLYEDWLANPEAWNEYAREVDYRRRYRASHNATYDRKYQRKK